MSDKERQLIEQVVRGWRDKLINLTGRNRLLNFNPGKRSSLLITEPGLDEVVDRVLSGGPLRVISTEEAVEEVQDEGDSTTLISTEDADSREDLLSLETPLEHIKRDTSLLGSSLSAAEIRTNLRSLFDHQSTVYLDAGLSVSYLAVGILKWTDPEAPDKPFRSPLVLIPLDLKSPSRRAPTTLNLREDDITTNRALALKLASLDIELPHLESQTPSGLIAYLDEIENMTRQHRGWSLETTCTLSYFTFHKEAMYQDLADHMESITNSELVRALATAGTDYVPDGLLFEPPDESSIDARDVPEEAHQVLDADSSQRAAIVAARDGKSFVLEGPPGTGKSQTIANIIANQISLGRTVLFVSEKIAALEVVKNRLDEIGLGSFLLELHSSKAKRSIVAQDLGKSLHRNAQAQTSFKPSERKTLKRQREALSDYADEMNNADNALGVSLHDLIGEISLRANLPRTPEASLNVGKLDADALADISESARALARAWRPGLEGPHFLWAGALSSDHPSLDLERAVESLNELSVVYEPYRSLASALDWNSPQGTALMVDLVSAFVALPEDLPTDLLTRDDWISVLETAGLLTELLQETERAESQLRELSGSNWEEFLGRREAHQVQETISALTNMEPAVSVKSGERVYQIEQLRESLESPAKTIAELIRKSGEVANSLGLLTPLTLEEAADLVEVHDRATGQHRPEASWFKTDVDIDVEKAIASLKELHAARSDARATASEYFRSTILDSDPRELHIRFSNQHTGLRKLSSARRIDKKAVQNACQAGVNAKNAIDLLPLAIAWQESEENLSQGVDRYADLLGKRYSGDDTDWEDLSLALENARAIARKARASAFEQLAHAAAHGSQVDLLLQQTVSSLSQDLAAFPTQMELLSSYVQVNEVLAKSLPDQSAWLADALRLTESLIHHIYEFNSVGDNDFTLSQASHIEQGISEVQAARLRLISESPNIEAVFHHLKGLRQVDIDAFNAHISAAQDLREKASRSPDEPDALDAESPIHEELLRNLGNVDLPEGLASAHQQWVASRDAVLNHFDPEHQLELIDWFSTWDGTNELLDRLSLDDSGPAEWLAYQQARAELQEWGFNEVIECLSELEVPSEAVPQIIRREALRPWVEHQLANSPAFKGALSQERDSLVDEFAAGDRQLIATAVADIVDLANARKPTANLGQSKRIDSEAQKKTRHKPIRQLLNETASVAQKLKPVFMMSPLAVSQFLTANMKFDLVIFDEASQVLPEDAINCIYRADQLIIAGDDNQLPPTSFFEIEDATPQEELVDEYASAQDFESILKIAKGSGAFTTLTLKWHYRSRHEDLITFSNQRFYRGELITFPSTMTSGPNVGVDFFLVDDGLYARGGARNNMPEARFVAQRIAHHYDTRPGMSLGVVALSQSQSDAIESALDELIRQRPSLERQIDTSRLDGLFIKNLEAVQGDERDVMIMSIGYGPDEHGKFTMNFGPMNRDGGWRRLNVAVTRARYRNEIVASFDPSQMAASTQKSVQALRHYLDYAQRGIGALALDSTLSLGDAESPFEESVLQWLTSEGFSVVTQVGTSGYRIDMAVQRPGQPGQFVLGIECDGAAYHSSRAARDRDRLREEVLTRLGWRLHRIWGTSWYRNREHEQQRLRRAIEEAIADKQSAILPVSRQTPPAPVTVVEEVDIDIESLPEWVETYSPAQPPKPPKSMNPAASDAVPHLARTLEFVIAEEGPIHREILLQRLKRTWNITRVSPQIQRNIDKSLEKVSQYLDGDFFHGFDDDEVLPTRQHNADSRRNIAHVHHREIADTAWQISRSAVEISYDDLVMSTARYLGFSRLIGEVRDRISIVVDGLREDGYLVGERNRLQWSEIPTE